MSLFIFVRFTPWQIDTWRLCSIFSGKNVFCSQKSIPNPTARKSEEMLVENKTIEREYVKVAIIQ